VWTNTIASDDAPGAASAAALFEDPRVHQFHDPERMVGQLYAPTLKMPSLKEVAAASGVEPEAFEGRFGNGYIYGKAAVFDTVLFFPPGVEWGATAPEPASFVTQLDPAIFRVDAERYRFGKEMGDEMARLARALLAAVPAWRSTEPLEVLSAAAAGEELALLVRARGSAEVRVLLGAPLRPLEEVARLLDMDRPLALVAHAGEGLRLYAKRSEGVWTVQRSDDGRRWSPPERVAGLPPGAALAAPEREVEVEVAGARWRVWAKAPATPPAQELGAFELYVEPAEAR
jgi:hypothetical protein